MGKLWNVDSLEDLIKRVTGFLRKDRWSCTRCRFFQGFNKRGFLHCEHTEPGEDKDDRWGADYDCRGEKYKPAPHGVYVIIYVEGESQEEVERKLRDTIKSIKHVKAVYSFRRRLKPPFRFDEDPVENVLSSIRVDLGVIPCQLDRSAKVAVRHVIRREKRSMLIIYEANRASDVEVRYKLQKRVKSKKDFLKFLKSNLEKMDVVKAVVERGDFWIEYTYDAKNGFEVDIWKRKSISWTSTTPWFL